MRLIDADALIEIEAERAKRSYHNAYIFGDLKAMLEKAPTIDPVKHGYWDTWAGGLAKCSVCGHEYIDAIECTDYCGNCGAKMDADRPPKGKWRLLNGKWTCSECSNKTDWPLKVCDVCASEMEIEI